MKNNRIVSALIFSIFMQAPALAHAQVRPPASKNPVQNPAPKITCKDVAEALIEYYRNTRDIVQEIPKIYSASALMLESMGTALQDPSPQSKQVVAGKMSSLAGSHRSTATAADKNIKDMVYIGDRLVSMSYNCMTKGTPIP
jgi:hypothetical protein